MAGDINPATEPWFLIDVGSGRPIRCHEYVVVGMVTACRWCDFVDGDEDEGCDATLVSRYLQRKIDFVYGLREVRS